MKRLLLTALVFLALASLGSASLNCVSPPGDWVITGSVVCDNETVNLHGKLILQAGGSLVINNSRLNCCDPSQGSHCGEAAYRNSVILNAPATIQNTDITDCGVNDTTFVANSALTLKGSTLDDCAPIKLKANSNAIQENTFTNSIPYSRSLFGRPSAFLLFENSGSNVISGNTFSGVGTGDPGCCGYARQPPGLFRSAISLKNSNAQMAGNFITDSNFGISLDGSSGSVVQDNNLSGIAVAGITANAHAGIKITGNIFSDVVAAGVALNGTSGANVSTNLFLNTPSGCADLQLGSPPYMPYSSILLRQSGGGNLKGNNVQSACKALTVFNSNNNTVDGLSSSAETDVYAYYSTLSVLRSSLSAGVTSFGGSTVNLVDTAPPSLNVQDTAKVYVKWLVDFEVRNKTGSLIPNANIVGRRSGGAVEFNVTPATGAVNDLLVVDYYVTSGGTTQYNDYNVTASRTGFKRNSTITGLSASDLLINITLNKQLLPPVAEAGNSKLGYVNQIILFNFSQSYDPDGNITKYFVTWGDGLNSTSSIPYMSHMYTSTGLKLVNLTVTDNDSLKSSDYTTIQINSQMSSLIKMSNLKR